MRQFVTSFVVVSCLSTPVVALQTRGAGAKPAIKACAILTRDLVEPFAANKRVLDLMEPEEEVTGSMSACEYGIVRFQHAPFPAGGKRIAPTGYEPLPGLGDEAFFRNNRNTYAELVVWSGAHYFTLQVGVPTGSTVEAIKPRTIALARAIMQKLK